MNTMSGVVSTGKRWSGAIVVTLFLILNSLVADASAAPTVTAVTPANGVRGVPVNTTINATFSEPMNPDTITTGSFSASRFIGIKAVAAGYAHSLALKQDGTVAAWGANYAGQTSVPAALSGVTAIAVGTDHSLSMKQDGTVMAWGDNSFGQCAVPANLSQVKAVAGGIGHSLALKQDGAVVAWGDGGMGQTAVPAGLSGVTAIAAGWYHSVALKQDGTVAAWGGNLSGQTSVPLGLTGVTAIAAGMEHTVALKQDGTVVAWGRSLEGQTAVPAGLSGVTAIAAGGLFSIALKTDGTVVAWGNNNSGQTTIPAGLGGVTAIAAGQSHAVALKRDGTVVAWGAASSGQLSVPAGLNGESTVPGMVSYDPVTRTATWTPASPLTPGSAYHVAVTIDVASLAGSHLPAAVSWNFATVGAIVSGLVINGPALVSENSSATYTATATWSDNFTSTITPIWSVSPDTVAAIDGAGNLTTLTVSADQVITVSGTYSSGGSSLTAYRIVTIVKNQAMPGDVNNDKIVNVFDALLALQYAVGLHHPTDEATFKTIGDVAPLDAGGKPKGDTVVNVFDALAILRHAVGLDGW